MHPKDIERVQQEVHTPNKIRMYEKQKQSKELDKELEEQRKLGYEVGRLKMEHDNDLLNQEMVMIRNENKEFINKK